MVGGGYQSLSVVRFSATTFKSLSDLLRPGWLRPKTPDMTSVFVIRFFPSIFMPYYFSMFGGMLCIMGHAAVQLRVSRAEFIAR